MAATRGVSWLALLQFADAPCRDEKQCDYQDEHHDWGEEAEPETHSPCAVAVGPPRPDPLLDITDTKLKQDDRRE